MNFLRGFSLTAASTLLVYVLAFLNQSLLARLLPAEDYGRLAFWSTTILFGTLLLGEWLTRGSTYLIGRERAIRPAVTNAAAYCGTLILVVCAAAAWHLSGPGQAVLPLTWVLVAALVALNTAQKAGLGILLGQDRINRYAVVPLFFVLAYLGGNLLGNALWRVSLERVLLVWLGAMGLSALAAWMPGLRHSLRADALDTRFLRRTLKIGGRGALSYMLIFILFRSNIWLIQHFMGSSAVGTFKVATLFADMMQRLPNVAGVVLLAKVVRGDDERSNLSLPVAQATLVFSLICALGLVVLGPTLIRVFYPRFPEAYTPLVWLLPGLLCSGFASVLNTRLAGEGYPPITVWAPGLAAVISVALNSCLIPRYGLSGAAAGTSFSLALWAGLVSAAYFRRTGLRWLDLLRLERLAASIRDVVGSPSQESREP
jgi:O-antigen/teichoic acid export membrane protein